VELAVCALLLGDTQRALGVLRLDEGGEGGSGQQAGGGGRRPLPASHAAIKAYVLVGGG
jgi:hypothetical protein